MTRRLAPVWALVLACGSPERAEPCTVAQNDDGTATMSCPDGSSATFGASGESCTVAQQPDGSALITCPDGSSATVGGGAGQACEVTHAGEGLYQLSCPDGSTATFSAIEGEPVTPTPQDPTEAPTDPTGATEAPSPTEAPGSSPPPTPTVEASPPPEPTATPSPTPAPGPVVCAGDYSVSSAVQMAVVEGCQEITGDLNLSGPLTDLSRLESLVKIGGDLTLQAAYLESTAGLENLEYIGGALRLVGVTALARAEFQALTWVPTVALEGVGDPFTLVVPSLHRETLLELTVPPAELTIEGTGALKLLNTIISAGTLEVFRLRGVEHLQASLTFMQPAPGKPYALELVDLGDVVAMDGVLGIQNNGALLVGPALETVGGLSISNLWRMTQAGLPALGHVAGDLTVGGNYELVDLAFPALASITGQLYVVSNPKLPQCDVDALIAQVQAQGGIGRGAVSSGNNTSGSCQ